MAKEQKVVLIIPLNGMNHATWKVQCQMADGLWGIDRASTWK